MTATPRPWHVAPDPDENFYELYGPPDPKITAAGISLPRHVASGLYRDDAELIVLAVNAHQALRHVAERLINDELDSHGRCGYCSGLGAHYASKDGPCAVEQAIEALRLSGFAS